MGSNQGVEEKILKKNKWRKWEQTGGVILVVVGYQSNVLPSLMLDGPIQHTHKAQLKDKEEC